MSLVQKIRCPVRESAYTKINALCAVEKNKSMCKNQRHLYLYFHKITFHQKESWLIVIIMKIVKFIANSYTYDWKKLSSPQ